MEVHGGNRDLAAAVAADGENAVAVVAAAGVADTVVVAGAESVEGYEGHCTSL